MNANFYGWDYFQWDEAWKEVEGCPIPVSLFAQLLMAVVLFKKEDKPLIDKAISVHARWWQTHSYPPLQSPIVLEQVYRARTEETEKA